MHKKVSAIDMSHASYGPCVVISPTSFQTLAATVKVVFQFIVVAMVLAFQAISLPAHAKNIEVVDEKSIRLVIEGQLAAFAKDDANKAFSYAAPNVRETFGSAANFMSMVRNKYPVVYRPATVTFLKAEGGGDEGDVIQRVQMIDTNGDVWLASYSVQKQKNKSWLITGCTLVAYKGRMV